MFKIKEKEAKHGYIADYTQGIYLSGIIVLILNAISFIATLRIPYEAYTLYPELMMDLLFGGVVGVILALIFLLVRTNLTLSD